MNELSLANLSVADAGPLELLDAAAAAGFDSVNMWLQDVGMQVSEEDAMKVLQATKLYSLKNKKMLSHAEFRDLARSVLGKTQAVAAVMAVADTGAAVADITSDVL